MTERHTTLIFKRTPMKKSSKSVQKQKKIDFSDLVILYWKRLTITEQTNILTEAPNVPQSDQQYGQTTFKSDNAIINVHK